MRTDEGNVRNTIRTQLEAPEPRMDLRVILAILRENRWLFLGIFCASLAIGLVYVEVVPPVYRARALLQVEPQQGSGAGSKLGAVSMFLPGLLQSQSSTRAQIQIMTSRSVLIPVIRRFHLDVSVRGATSRSIRVGQFKVPNGWIGKPLRLVAGSAGGYTLHGPSGRVVLMGRVGKVARGMNGTVRVLLRRMVLPPGRHLTLIRKRPLSVLPALRERLHSAERGSGTGMVSLALLGRHPVRVADLLNGLIAQYRRENRRVFLTEARRSLAFIGRRLPKLKRELNQAGSRFAAFQATHDTVSLKGQTHALLEELTALEAQLGQLQLVGASYAERYTRRFPRRAELMLEERILEGRIASLRARLERLPVQSQGYVRLREETLVYAKLYTNLLGIEQDLKIHAASAVGNVRVVDPAVPPLGPIEPRKGVDVFLAMVLGIVVGLFAAFLRHSLRQTLREPAALEEMFGLPLFAVIPHSQRERELGRPAREDPSRPVPLLVERDPEDLAVEALRSLRTSVRYAMEEANHRILVMGGATPGSGKSFVSANLARICADAGQRVLLVDADLRRGRLHCVFNCKRAPGLAELLSGPGAWQEALHLGTVDFLATGAVPDQPAELLMRPELPGLLKQLSAAYDLVIIDVPPILAVTDGLVVARHADLVLLVVRSERNGLDEVSTALRRYEQAGVEIRGFIFNDLRPHTARSGYRYQYRYAREREP